MQAQPQGPVGPLKFSLKCHLINHLNAGTNEKDLLAALAETLAETAHILLGRESAIDLLKQLIESVENRPQTRRSESWESTGTRHGGRKEAGLGEATKSQNDSELEARKSRILMKACEVFGSPTMATFWWKTPVTQLNNQRPIDLVATPAGADCVEEFLSHGVYL